MIDRAGQGRDIGGQKAGNKDGTSVLEPAGRFVAFWRDFRDHPNADRLGFSYSRLNAHFHTGQLSEDC